MMAVSLTTQPTLSLGRPETLFDDAFRRSELTATTYDVSPDGERFAMLQTRVNGAPQQIVLVLN